MKSGNCYKQKVDVLDLVVAETSEFNLTHGRVYLVTDVQSFGLFKITNDLGVADYYADEYFRFYKGETIN